MTGLLLLLLLQSAAGRPYPPVPIEKAALTHRTHICITAPLVYKRFMKPPTGDGDWHLTLAKIVKGVEHKIVVEVIPLIPLDVSGLRVGMTIEVCGIRRRDDGHGWAEIHPAETIEVKER